VSARGRLAWVLLALVIVALATAVGLAGGRGAAGDAAAFVPVILSFAVVGALIASRRPEHAIGWILLAEGIASAIAVLLQAYARLGASRHPQLAGTSWVAWAFTVALDPSLLFVTLTLLLFPDGRFRSPRWRTVGIVAIGSTVAAMLLSAVADTNLSNNFPRVHDPVQLLSRRAAIGPYGIAQEVGLILLAAAAIGVALRLRRARGDERQQLKWFAYATVIAAVGMIVTATIPLGVEPVVAFVVFAPLIPIAAGIAVLKYRLYDIDVVIGKTVVYATLAAFVTVVYVAIVVGIGTLVGDRSNAALSLVATAIVALAFQPARERVRRFANRLVYGDRATPYEVMAGFGRRVSGTMSVDDVLPEMAEAAARGVGADWARVQLLLPGGAMRELVWPPDATLSDGRVSRAIEVRYQGEAIGTIAVDKPGEERLTPSEDRLLADLATQAGLAMHNVRLTEELAVRLRRLAEQSAALQVSRERLVTARDAQRRGLERDIREGPQRELTEIGRRIRSVGALVEEDRARAERELDRLGERANATLEALRDLARGIFPPLLADQGVVAALEAHVRKVGADVRVEAGPAFAARRFDDDVEACVYFCCLQAIQNVIRHAGNAPAVVRLDLEGDTVGFSIEDDGPGFDVASTPHGMGLQIMQDRVDAFDGTLDVRSSPSGTTVTGRIPSGDVEEAVR
jgi:signal transduction histidine kinase